MAVLRLPPRVEFGVDDPEVLFEPEPPGRRVNEVARSSPSRFGMNLLAHETEKKSVWSEKVLVVACAGWGAPIAIDSFLGR